MTTRGLRIAALAFGVVALIGLVPDLQIVLLFDDSSQAAMERVRTMERVIPPLVALGGLVAGAALFWFGLRTDRPRLRGPALLAGALETAGVLVGLVFWAGFEAELFELGFDGTAFKAMVWSTALLVPAILLAVLSLASRADPRLTGGRLAFLGLGIAWSAGLPLFGMVTETWVHELLIQRHPWWWFLLDPMVMLATTLLLAAALWRAAWAIDRGHDQDLVGWPDVARGLRVYGDGLAWRISLTFIGMFLLFIGGMARSPEMIMLFGCLLAVGTAATGLVMLSGIARYARQPAGSPAAAPAWIGFAGMLMAAALDLVGLVLLAQVLAADRDRLVALQDGLGGITSRTISHWALAMGAVSLGSLLLSFGLVASHLRRPDMVRRVIGVVGGLLLSVAAVAAFFAYGPAVRDMGTALLVLVVLLILVVLLVLSYLKLVRSMEAAVDDPSVALPEARVVGRVAP